MKNQFIALECGDDVVCFDKNTLKVSQLREIVIKEIIKKWRQKISDYKTQIYDSSVGSLFGSISTGDEFIPISEFQLKAIKNCDFLQTGKNWQKGKLQIQVYIYPNSQKPNNICLEFYPDEPI
ncbi:MAG: KGK domain-containing protein [Nostoc sp. ChiSLP02]|nr:KGK domain-containing protein [Nostoc sp. DedSLP05]MDZ8100261.1 KGK domain-containing protein [Nostoc sp. DedSLP01]MDZ8188926.1 KGK domain-containing protein [Nostoc sp. ChiSLP02]